MASFRQRSVAVVALTLQRLEFVIAIQRASQWPRNMANAKSLRAKLWDGEDVKWTQTSTRLQAIDDGPHVGLQWQIVGPFDSGTNLMEAMIELNFPSAFKRAPGEARVWKHSVSGSRDFTQQFRSMGYDSHNFVLIAMVREPLSLLSSFKKASYDLYHCVEHWNDLVKPCTGYMRAMVCSSQQPCYFEARQETCHSISKQNNQTSPSWCRPMIFHDIADVIGRYFEQFHMLVKENNFAKVEIVHYEDLVSHPDLVMKRIGMALGVPLPDKIASVDDAAKDHGGAVGYQDAVKKLREKPWLKEIPVSILKSFCNSLSPEVKSEYSLGDCAPRSAFDTHD